MRVASLALLVFLLPMKAFSEGQLWGPINMKIWRETPCLVGRIATEADVKDGRAAFYVTGDPVMKALDIPLPACAILHGEKEKEIPIIVIQAVQTSKITAIGYRLLSGGNGVCSLSEIEILKEPDERFK